MLLEVVKVGLNTLGVIYLIEANYGVRLIPWVMLARRPLSFEHLTYSVTCTACLTCREMSGSGVLIYMVPIQLAARLTQLALLQRPIMTVVFVAVRGTASIRTTSGALTVSATSQTSGTSSAAFAFP